MPRVRQFEIAVHHQFIIKGEQNTGSRFTAIEHLGDLAKSLAEVDALTAILTKQIELLAEYRADLIKKYGQENDRGDIPARRGAGGGSEAGPGAPAGVA